MTDFPLTKEQLRAVEYAVTSVVEYHNVGDYGYGGEIFDRHEVGNWPEVIQTVLETVLVDTEWSGHWDRNGPIPRFCRVHDKNSVHMDGCVPVYVIGLNHEVTARKIMKLDGGHIGWGWNCSCGRTTDGCHNTEEKALAAGEEHIDT